MNINDRISFDVILENVGRLTRCMMTMDIAHDSDPQCYKNSYLYDELVFGIEGGEEQTCNQSILVVEVRIVVPLNTASRSYLLQRQTMLYP